MKLSEFDYSLPSELIAQQPAGYREQARLMLVKRDSAEIEHWHCRDLPELLGRDDLLVLNDSKVFPARLHGFCGDRRVEVLLLRDLGGGEWEALLRPGRRILSGQTIVFEPRGFEARVMEHDDRRIRHLVFKFEGRFWDWVERLGEVPLPPYIRRDRGEQPEDRSRYQTVYAMKRGSIAAPTAGLHFTHDLLRRIRHCFVTLHVGYGTFQPVTSEDVESHRVGAERFSVDQASAETISSQLEADRRIIAVGTTTTRVLEHQFAKHGCVRAGAGSTELYIRPGFQFRVVGGLLTNFHLPRSSLLILVTAFAGPDLIRRCYETAVRERYRFYSFGDAMLIL